MKTFLNFFAFSESAHQNEWENALGGVIFKLFAYWATLLKIKTHVNGRICFSSIHCCFYLAARGSPIKIPFEELNLKEMSICLLTLVLRK